MAVLNKKINEKISEIKHYLVFSAGVVPAFANSANLKNNSFLTIVFFVVISCSNVNSPSTIWRIIVSIDSNRNYKKE